MSQYILGVECAFDRVTAVASDASASLIGIGQVYAQMTSPGSLEQAARAAVLCALQAAELENARIAAICVAAPAWLRDREIDVIQAMSAEHVFVCDTAVALLYALAPEGPATAVCADVQMSACARDRDGRLFFAGGWHAQPAPGGADWIAAQAASECLLAADSLAPLTKIASLLCEATRANSLEEALQAEDPTYTSTLDAVVRAAAAGDPAGRRILRQAGKELAHVAFCLMHELVREPTPLALSGLVTMAGRHVLQPFRQTLGRLMPDAQVVRPVLLPAAGALLYAAYLLNGPLQTEMADRLYAPCAQFGAPTTAGS